MSQNIIDNLIQTIPNKLYSKIYFVIDRTQVERKQNLIQQKAIGHTMYRSAVYFQIK